MSNLRRAQSDEDTYKRARDFVMSRLAENHEECVELERQRDAIEAKYLAARQARVREEMPAVLRDDVDGAVRTFKAVP